MTLSFTGRKRLRKNFGKIVEIAQMPNLIEVQRTSYDQFLQLVKPGAGRKDEGLEAVFRQVFRSRTLANPRCSNMSITISKSPNTMSRSASSAP